jgi:hypothetical protein
MASEKSRRSQWLPYFSEQIRMSRAPSAPRSGFALDNLICSEAKVAVAIDGAKAITTGYES